MYHIILIDDEKIAMDGLYEVVAEEFKECMILKAGSGTEALHLFEQFRIDVAVIDINMPGINGLELQKNVQEKWPRCKSIFLTGYDRADYIRQAMRSGGTDYILKLEGDDMVVDAIRKNLGRLEEEEKRKLENVRMKQLIHEREKKLRGYLLHQLLTEPVKDEAAFLQQSMEVGAAVDFTKPVWILAGKVMDGSKEKEEGISRKEALDGILKELVDVECHRESIFDTDSIVVWMFQPEQDANLSGLYKMKHKELQNKILQYLELVENAFYIETGENAVFLGMWRESSLSDIFQDYKKIKMGFLQMNFWRQGNVILLKEEMLKEESINYAKQEDVYPILCEYIRSGLRKETYTILLQALRRGDAEGKITPRSFYECGLMIHKFIDKYHLQEVMNQKYNLNKLLDFHDFENEFEVEYYLADILHKIFQQLELQGELSNDRVLSVINSYIHGHVESDLSMSVLAGLVHLHPSYLSRIYKKKMGMSITDYIARVRIKKAQQLLEETDKKVWEIARETGFSSPTYFSNFFGKEFSMTPQEYRNKYRR